MKDFSSSGVHRALINLMRTRAAKPAWLPSILGAIALGGILAFGTTSARANHPIPDGGTMCHRIAGTGIGGWDAATNFTYTHYSMWNTSPERPETSYTASREEPGPIVTYSYTKVGGGYHDHFVGFNVWRRSRLWCCDGGYVTDWEVEQYVSLQGSCY